MTALRCGKHNTSYDSERHASCPRCNPNVPHPDVEDAVFSLIADLSGLYPKRWADAYSMDDLGDLLNEIARDADALSLKVRGLNAAIDERVAQGCVRAGSVTSHNQERLGAFEIA